MTYILLNLKSLLMVIWLIFFALFKETNIYFESNQINSSSSRHEIPPQKESTE